MKKQTLFLILICLNFTHIQSAYSQLYPGNAYYDNTGKVYYYATDGNAYYYPEDVQRQYQKTPQAQPELITPKSNLLDANWWKSATLEKVKQEIADGTDVNATGNDRAGQNSDGDLRENVTPLMFALKYGNPSLDVVKALIKAGADVNAKEKVTGLTVLMYATEDVTNSEIIQALIDAGANVNNKKNDGWTPLMLAARYNENPDVIKVLLKHGADIDNLRVLAVSQYNPNPEVRKLVVSEIEKNYEEADYSDRSDFDSRVSGCISTEEFKQDFYSSLSVVDQFELMMTSALSLGMQDSQRSKECDCIFNAVQAYLGETEYKKAIDAFNQGRQGTYKKAVKKAIPAAFGVCF